MSSVFVDTLYWYGLANPHDQWHPIVLRARARLGSVQLVTTEEVLIEFLTAMSGGGDYLRRVAATLVRTILADPNTACYHKRTSRSCEGSNCTSSAPTKPTAWSTASR
jgi:hypothetical protein